MSKSDDLYSIWELHRQNAELHGACRDGLPPCPICLRPVAPPGSAHVFGTAIPTRGHVAPFASGDEQRDCVLECQPCNNRFGHWYDAAYASQVKTDRFRSKALPEHEQIKLLRRSGSWLCVNGAPGSAKLRRENGGIVMEIHLSGHAPDLSGGIQLEIVDPPFARVVVSLLHSAYLRLVWHLGYEYVLEPSVQGVRQSLHRAVSGTERMDDAELMKRFGRYGTTMLRQERPESWSNLGIIYAPALLASFVVFVPGMAGRAYVLFLPGFGQGAVGLYDRLREAGAQRVDVRQVIWDATRSERLSHAGAVNWGRDFWREARIAV